jgi:hypothetical protein
MKASVSSLALRPILIISCESIARIFPWQSQKPANFLSFIYIDARPRFLLTVFCKNSRYRRIHQMLKTMPAMAAAITHRVWILEIF